MPIYEYQCEGCGEVFEVLQRLSDPPPESHEACGSTKVHRVMSAAAFVFKGDGWYITDYARKDKDKGAGGAGKKAGDKAGDKGSDKGGGGSSSSSGSSTSGSSGGASSGGSSGGSAPSSSSGSKTAAA